MIASFYQRRLRAAMKQNWRRIIASGHLTTGVVIFLLTITVLIIVSPTRTIQLQARTLSAEIELTGEPFAWDLTGATLCLPIFDFEQPPTAPCKIGEVFEELFDGPTIWPKGQTLALAWSEDELQITLLKEGIGWPVGSILRLPLENAMQNGALAFSGYLTLGQEMSAGANGYTLDGRYAIFERGLIGSLLNWPPDITRQGEIQRGERLQIVCQKSVFAKCDGREIFGKAGLYENSVTASFSLDHDGLSGIHVVALGEESNSALQIAYAGNSSALLIKPNWMQRIAASSSLLALTLLMSFLAPFILPLLGRREKKPKE